MYQPTTDQITDYTAGDCWALAGVLNQMTGWQIVAVLPDYRGVIEPGNMASDWSHMAVIDPHGLILDIRGPQPVGLFLRRWAYHHCQAKIVHVSREAWDFECAAWGNEPVRVNSWSVVRRTARSMLDTLYPGVLVSSV